MRGARMLDKLPPLCIILEIGPQAPSNSIQSDNLLATPQDWDSINTLLGGAGVVVLSMVSMEVGVDNHQGMSVSSLNEERKRLADQRFKVDPDAK
jgi:hypothetical protein